MRGIAVRITVTGRVTRIFRQGNANSRKVWLSGCSVMLALLLSSFSTAGKAKAGQTEA